MVRNNKRFALAFRIGALTFAVAGVTAQIGVFKGAVSFGSFMYYTIQSNLLVVALFAMLVVRTAISLRDGDQGSSGWFPRFEMVCAADVLVTFIVFWALLAGGLEADYLLSFENLAVHTVTPLLCLADYLLFTKPRHMRYRDVYLTCIYPLFYAAFVTIAGFAGHVYYYTTASAFSSRLIPVRFPYFFLDFDRIGNMVFAYIAGISVFVILLGHGIYLLDAKVRKVK